MKNKIIGMLLVSNIVMILCGLNIVNHLYSRIEGLENVNTKHYNMIEELKKEIED